MAPPPALSAAEPNSPPDHPDSNPSPVTTVTSVADEPHRGDNPGEPRDPRPQSIVPPHHPPVIDVPPFWTRHDRSVSSVSYHSVHHLRRDAIRLEDHSEEDHEQTQACWAESVTIQDHLIVSGPTGIGAYIVWPVTVHTLQGGDMTIRKRYSEFDQLHQDLVRSFPHADAMIPSLPRKSVVSRFRPKFLEQRKAGLSHFLNCILLNPEFAASPVLKDFIFS